jgi:tRNA (guanine26-N2/guanine27-N2)-dimethyltransferase
VSEIEGSLGIVEGQTELLVPILHSSRGPGKRQGGVFYNEQMAFNRDISVMLFDAIDFTGKEVLDSMAGTGARGIRVANEVARDFMIYVNDSNEEALQYIERNIELNNLDNCRASNFDMRCLLSDRPFDYVDVDPFGTPVPYVTAAIQGCKRNGILGITATDTAPLAGTHPKKCARRYGARSIRCTFGHELGLRILVGYLVRKSAELDMGAKPILCFYADHYFRLHMRMRASAQEADKSLDQLGYIRYRPEDGFRSFSREYDCAESYGPLWGGPLYDRTILESMEVRDGLADRTRCIKYLSIWKAELDIPYFYDNDEIASMLHASPPPMNRLLEKLGEVGKVSRTHFSPTAFKTDIGLTDLIAIVSEIV